MARSLKYAASLHREVSVTDARLQYELTSAGILFEENEVMSNSEQPTICTSTVLNGTAVLRVTPSHISLLDSGESKR